MPACSLSSILVLPMTIIPLWPIERWTKGGRPAHLITFACALVFLESVVVKRRERHMTFARNLAARGLMRRMAIVSSSHIFGTSNAGAELDPRAEEIKHQSIQIWRLPQLLNSRTETGPQRHLRR